MVDMLFFTLTPHGTPCCRRDKTLTPLACRCSVHAMPAMSTTRQGTGWYVVGGRMQIIYNQRIAVLWMWWVQWWSHSARITSSQSGKPHGDQQIQTLITSQTRRTNIWEIARWVLTSHAHAQWKDNGIASHKHSHQINLFALHKNEISIKNKKAWKNVNQKK